MAYLPKAKQFVFIPFICYLCISCLSYKPQARKASTSKIVENFYLGSEGEQFFIKPLVFKNEEKEQCLVDFTIKFNNSIEEQDSAVVNFSLISPIIIKKLTSVAIYSDHQKINLDKITSLFNESKSKGYVSRFSSKCSFTELNELFKDNNWKIAVTKNTTSSDFFPNKKAKKSIAKINNGVFVLFQ